MADILIRGFEMPEKCGLCICFTAEQDAESCNALDRNVDADGPPETDCPLYGLQPHGDLIDRDALLAEYERDERAADEHGREFSFSFDSGGTSCTEWWIVQQKLMDAPVIVPSNKEETE